MAPVTLLQSRTSLLIWQGRKKPQWHLGHSHCYHANITHVSAVALTHHIFSQWVMTWLSYHWVLIITIIREILFSRRRKKNAFWKMHCQSPLRCMYANQDFSLREWLLITALKLLTIWYNNQKLEAVLCFGHSCSFFVVCIFVPCTGRRKPSPSSPGWSHAIQALHWGKGQIHTSARLLQCSHSLPPQACRNTAATIKPLICSQHCRKAHVSMCLGVQLFQPLVTPALTRPHKT